MTRARERGPRRVSAGGPGNRAARFPFRGAVRGPARGYPRAMPEIGRTLKPRTRAAWRAWLDRHPAEREIWLLLAKKHVPGRWLGYDEAVEEALCVGWIDGLVKAVDGDFRAVRFTPRKRGSVWSVLNKRRVARLTRAGRMTEAGLVHVRLARASGAWAAAEAADTDRRTASLAAPPDLAAALAAAPAAGARFAAEPPGYRRLVLRWIRDSRRPETRARRVGRVVEAAVAGVRLFR